MKILLLCLHAFGTMEFSPFVDVFGWARNDLGCDIRVVTCGHNRRVVSTFGVPIEVDTLVSEVRVEDYAALAIPGGFEEYDFYREAYDGKTLELIRAFAAAGKPIASVCVGSLPIAKSGVLIGRKATTYHLQDGRRRRQLAELGAVLGDEWIVEEGNIITSSCPRTAPEVAFALLGQLTSPETVEQVKRNMGFA